jgi:hypothetical protein
VVIFVESHTQQWLLFSKSAQGIWHTFLFKYLEYLNIRPGGTDGQSLDHCAPELDVYKLLLHWAENHYIPTNALVLLHLDAIHHEQRFAQSVSCYGLILVVVARLSMLAGLVEIEDRPVFGSQMSSIWKHELCQSTVRRPNISNIRTMRRPEYLLFICPSR